jgi:hypothetical protein
MRTTQTTQAPTSDPPGRTAVPRRLISVRHRPLPAAAVAAALALPFAALASGPVAAADGVSVSAAGSTVHASTSSCPDGGNASLLSSGQAIFAQGRQATLTSSGANQSVSWPNVSSGSHTVIVMCSDGTTAGTGTVSVTGSSLTAPSGSPAPTTQPPTPAPVVPTTPTTPATPSTVAPSTTSPALGVQGGMGGSAKDRGPLTAAIGGTMVAAATGFGAWCLYRRRTRTPG